MEIQFQAGKLSESEVRYNPSRILLESTALVAQNRMLLESIALVAQNRMPLESTAPVAQNRIAARANQAASSEPNYQVNATAQSENWPALRAGRRDREAKAKSDNLFWRVLLSAAQAAKSNSQFSGSGDT